MVAQLPDTSKEMGELPSHVVSIAILNAAHTFKNGKLTDLQAVQYAYLFFRAFKGLAVDLCLSFSERNKRRVFFIARSAEDAFRVVKVELNFLYEVLFTKFPVIYRRLGYFSRFFSSFAVIISLVLFYETDKAKIEGEKWLMCQLPTLFLLGQLHWMYYAYILKPDHHGP